MFTVSIVLLYVFPFDLSLLLLFSEDGWLCPCIFIFWGWVAMSLESLWGTIREGWEAEECDLNSLGLAPHTWPAALPRVHRHHFVLCDQLESTCNPGLLRSFPSHALMFRRLHSQVSTCLALFPLSTKPLLRDSFHWIALKIADHIPTYYSRVTSFP